MLRPKCGHSILGEPDPVRDVDWSPIGVSRELSLGPKMSGLAQLTISESPFRDLALDELARASFQVTLGFKKVVWTKHVIFVGLTENVASFNSSPDIGFHIGLTSIY